MNEARWDEYPDFTATEFRCKHTGLDGMQHEFMSVLQRVRTSYGKPMRVTSGYRHPSHPVEARKLHSRGEHTLGMCADIACDNGHDRYDLVMLALQHGIRRIGIANTFIHLGIGGNGLPNQVIWDYQ